MTIVCFVSGSGTNYREIVARNPNHDYLVFTNRPGCGAVAIARQNQHPVIELSQVTYLQEAKKIYAPDPVPRNCPERIQYEQEVSRLIENKLNKEPDLICLAGYNLWTTDWIVEKYYPRILNVHPGDTTKDYAGLHWVPAAKAIFAGDGELRSTLFFVDKTEDKGPVLAQSAPLIILTTLKELESRGKTGLVAALREVVIFGAMRNIKSFEEFKEKASRDLIKKLELVCSSLQDELKVTGDWKIYPFAVHDLIAQGRVEIDENTVYIDSQPMPPPGYRLDEH
jgi:folate-dependent phosphoribosylglycinamide formyltransferase PurN